MFPAEMDKLYRRRVHRRQIKICGAIKAMDGKICTRPRGWWTQHQGRGHCYVHQTKEERMVLTMGYEISGELNITPWEAILQSVRKAAARVAWVDQRLAEIVAEDPDDPGLGKWLLHSRKERQLLAQMAKGAIDAGIAERVVRNMETELENTVKAIIAGVNALGLGDEDRLKALGAAKKNLMATFEDDNGAGMLTVGNKELTRRAG